MNHLLDLSKRSRIRVPILRKAVTNNSCVSPANQEFHDSQTLKFPVTYNYMWDFPLTHEPINMSSFNHLLNFMRSAFFIAYPNPPQHPFLPPHLQFWKGNYLVDNSPLTLVNERKYSNNFCVPTFSTTQSGEN